MVYHDFVDLPKLAEVVRLLENLRVRQSRTQTNNKNQIFLHNPHIGQMLPVLSYFLFLRLIFLPFISLKREQKSLQDHSMPLYVTLILAISSDVRGLKSAGFSV